MTQLLTGLETFIYLLRRTRITTVPHNGELCLDHACIEELLIGTVIFGLTRTRLYFRYPNGRVDQLSHKGTCEGSNSMLSSSIYTASCVWFSASDRTKVDNMASLFLFKFYQYRSCSTLKRVKMNGIPFISNCVTDISPKTFVANIPSMSASAISPTCSTPKT